MNKRICQNKTIGKFFLERRRKAAFLSSDQAFGPAVAAVNMVTVATKAATEEYKGSALVALHAKEAFDAGK